MVIGVGDVMRVLGGGWVVSCQGILWLITNCLSYGGKQELIVCLDGHIILHQDSLINPLYIQAVGS